MRGRDRWSDAGGYGTGARRTRAARPRRLGRTAAAAILLALAGWLGWWYPDAHEDVSPANTARDDGMAVCAAPRVHDGDSVRCTGLPQALRLDAIDAPEVEGSPACRDARAPSRDCDFTAGERSRAALAALLANARVVTYEVTGDGSYDRLSARLYADGRNVECAMVAGGHAVERYGKLDC